MKSRFRVGLIAFVALAFCASDALAQRGSADPKSATQLRGLRLEPRGDKMTVVVEADGPPQHRVTVLEEQNQIVLDILGARNPLKSQKPLITHPLLDGVRAFEIPVPPEPPAMRAGTLGRLIFDLKQPASYKVDVDGRRLKVELSPKPQARPGKPTTAKPTTTSRELPTAQAPLPPSSKYPKASIDPADIDPAFFFDAPAASSDQYTMGPEDVIEIHVFELDQLNRTVRVSGEGNIDLPLIGAVSVLGATSDDVAKAVADRLKNRYLQNPQVGVFIKEFNSKKVSLLGAVARPATYPLSGKRNLLQILAEAGGLAPSHGKQLYLFRQAPDGRSTRLTVPLDELLVKGEARWNVWLHAGDVVSVPAEPTISVSVLGAVRTPGIHAIPSGDGATLAKAIARAGGLSERASQSGVTIKRRDPSGKETLLKVDLGDILSGKKPDVLLQDGDVIVVKESFF